MDPTETARVRHSLAPASQTACYEPWLKVCVLLRYALTTSWTVESWEEVCRQLPWLLAEQRWIRRTGRFN